LSIAVKPHACSWRIDPEGNCIADDLSDS